MWRHEDHFSVYLYLKKEDAEKLRSISESLCKAFPELFIAPPDMFAFPVTIYQFPFPRPVRGERYPDTLTKYLDEFNGCDRWYPGKIRFSTHSLLIDNYCFQLCLTPAEASDQYKMTRITQDLKDHYGWEPCSPVLTLAQIRPGRVFPALVLEALEHVLEKLDFEMTAELHSLTLEILYDDGTLDREEQE